MDRPLAKLVYHLTPALALVLPFTGCQRSVATSEAPQSADMTLASSVTLSSSEPPLRLAEPREFRLKDLALPIELRSGMRTHAANEGVTTGHNALTQTGSNQNIPGPTLAAPAPAQPQWNAPWASSNGLEANSEVPELTPAQPPLQPSLEPVHRPTPSINDISPEAGTELPWASDTIRTPEMEAVNKRADGHIKRGVDLAQRRASFSAKGEFIRGLELISAAIDTSQHSRAHANALANGLKAMDEVDDFSPPSAQLSSQLNLKLIIDAHQTPILKQADFETLTPIAAIQAYLTYAREQLVVAVGKEPIGSKGLYAMGRLQMLPGRRGNNDWTQGGPKAVVFYGAAISADPKNAIAANELGVLLARFGKYPEAKDALLHSAMTRPEPAAWHNLAMIHKQFGENDMAARAEQESKLAAAAAEKISVAGQHTVRWVDPQTFAQTARPTPVITPNSTVEPKAASKQALPSETKKTAFGWLPWMKPTTK